MFWWMLTLFQTSFVSCSSYVGTQEGENAGIFHWFTVLSEQMKSVCDLCSVTPRHFDNLLTFFILWNNTWNIEHLSYGNLVVGVTHNSFFKKKKTREIISWKPNVKEFVLTASDLTLNKIFQSDAFLLLFLWLFQQPFSSLSKSFPL